MVRQPHLSGIVDFGLSIEKRSEMTNSYRKLQGFGSAFRMSTMLLNVCNMSTRHAERVKAVYAEVAVRCEVRGLGAVLISTAPI